MLKKKFIAIAGATVVTVSLLVGVTYAWFTNTRTATAGQITAGKLGIAFEITEPTGTQTPLYPQLTLPDGKPDTSGTVADVATKTITLTNDSDRQVLVKVSGAGMTVMGSEVDADGNVDETINTRGTVEITNPTALKFLYTPDNTDVKYTKIGNDMYIYLPTGNEVVNVAVQVWIDGVTGGNEYQSATISFDEMTAKAVQYRQAAVETELGLTEAQASALAAQFGVAFE